MGIIIIVIALVVYGLHAEWSGWMFNILAVLVTLDCAISVLAAWCVNNLQSTLSKEDYIEEMEKMYFDRSAVTVYLKILLCAIGSVMSYETSSNYLFLTFYALFVSESVIEYKYQTFDR